MEQIPEIWLDYGPATEEDMLIKSYRYTVCEILREIYKVTKDERIKFKLRVATAMAKSMAARITKYDGKRWGAHQYIWNPNKRHDRAKQKYEKLYGEWRATTDEMPELADPPEWVQYARRRRRRERKAKERGKK